jgi:hypothetical protein
MTKAETVAILAVIETAYPNIKRTEQQRMEAVNLWANLFADDDPQDVAIAVKAYIVGDTTGFPPAIGAIKQKIVQMHKPQLMGEVEAWGLVSRACRNGYYGSEEEFAKLPEDIQRTIGSPSQLRDWSMLDESTLESVIASNFQRAYRVSQARTREYEALPGAYKPMLTEGE